MELSFHVITWSYNYHFTHTHKCYNCHCTVTVTHTAPQRISSVIIYKNFFGFRVNDCKWMILHCNGMVCNSTGVINVVYCNLHIPSVNVCDFALHWIAYHWTEYHCMTLQWYRSMCAILHTIGLHCIGLHTSGKRSVCAAGLFRIIRAQLATKGGF